ncbi:MAG: hypothetical protein LBK55_10755 [Azoarcus sp.]|nr:hypothetical protein [Azoarcus sp.]
MQAATPEPETAAAPSVAADPVIAAQPPESPPAGTPTETAIPPLSAITLDAIPALNFAQPIAAAASKEDEPPAATEKTASGSDAGPSEAETAPFLWRKVSREEKSQYRPRHSTKKTRGDAGPSEPAQLPNIPPEPEKTIAYASLEPPAPAVLPPETEPAHSGQHIVGDEPAPLAAVPPLAENAPVMPDIPPPADEPDVFIAFPEWEKRYTAEISAATSMAEWGRIEPTMSGARDFPPPIAPPPPRANTGAVFAMIGVAVVLVLALSGLWWFFDRTSAAPEAFHEDAPEIASETPPPLTVGTNETPPAETLAVPAQETNGPLPEFDSASRPEPETPLPVIPSLPVNQQPGSHNRTDNDIEPLPESLPSPREPTSMPSAASTAPPPSSRASATPSPPSRPPAIAPIPLPSPPAQEYGANAPASRQEPMRTATPPPTAEPEWNPPPAATPPPPIDEPAWEAPRPIPPSPPSAIRERPQQDSPPWRDRLRRELSNCEDFFCRERLREQYCSDRWRMLPECRGASL